MPSPIGQSVELRTLEQEVAGWIPVSANILSKDWWKSLLQDSFLSHRCPFFDNSYVGKQPVAWNKYCAEDWLKELQESMDRCTGRRNITEILLKTTLDTIQSINQYGNMTLGLQPGDMEFFLSKDLKWSTDNGSG